MGLLSKTASGSRGATSFDRGSRKIYVAKVGRHQGSDLRLTQPGTDANREQLRVLVAEDDRRLRESVAANLTRRGMLVRRTEDPHSINFLLKHFRPHVVVLDNHFDRHGVDFKTMLPELIGMYPNLNIVVTTEETSADSPSSNDPVAWGATGVIEKSRMLHESGLAEMILQAVAP